MAINLNINQKINDDQQHALAIQVQSTLTLYRYHEYNIPRNYSPLNLSYHNITRWIIYGSPIFFYLIKWIWHSLHQRPLIGCHFWYFWLDFKKISDCALSLKSRYWLAVMWSIIYESQVYSSPIISTRIHFLILWRQNWTL